MRYPTTINNLLFRRRRGLATVVLVAYGLGLGFIFLPILPEKSTETPFPCQNHACGCCSAEQCWKACCCFTKEQKIAWAKANDVPIPYHLLGTDSAMKLAQQEKPVEVRGSCCSKKPAGGCCSQSTEHQGCCEQKSSNETTVQCRSSAKHPSDKNRSRTVAITDVLACHGLQMMWILTPPTLPDAARGVSITLPRGFEFLRWSDDLLVSEFRTPPVPPPRLG